jgi:hypothetical protein
VIVLKVFLMVGIGILNLFSSDFIDGMCVVALALAVIIIRGSTFHPLAAGEPISREIVLGMTFVCLNSSVT